MRFVNSDAGERLNVRGINAKVVVPGTIRTGDAIVPADEAARRPPTDAAVRSGGARWPTR